METFLQKEERKESDFYNTLSTPYTGEMTKYK